MFFCKYWYFLSCQFFYITHCSRDKFKKIWKFEVLDIIISNILNFPPIMSILKTKSLYCSLKLICKYTLPVLKTSQSVRVVFTIALKMKWRIYMPIIIVFTTFGIKGRVKIYVYPIVLLLTYLGHGTSRYFCTSF